MGFIYNLYNAVKEGNKFFCNLYIESSNNFIYILISTYYKRLIGLPVLKPKIKKEKSFNLFNYV